MSFYIGFYRSGKTRVFQTSKAVTKKSFPFYEKVMGPFESEEEAREEASRHRLRIGGVLDARRSNPGAAWHEKERIQDTNSAANAKDAVNTAFFGGRALAHSESRDESRRLGLNPRRRNPGSDWKIWITFNRETAAQDEVLYLKTKGRDARATFNPNSRKWEVWVSGWRSENPRRAIPGGTSTYCKCGHLLDVHYISRRHYPPSDYCKLCSCSNYTVERVSQKDLARARRSTRSRLKKNPPGHKIYDNILAIEARKGKNSLWPQESFRHDFKGGATVEGMQDGSLRIKSKSGKRLWKNFNYGGE